MSSKILESKESWFPGTEFKESRQLYDSNPASDERIYRKLQFLQTCSTHPAANLLWTKKESAMTNDVIVCSPELQFFL
jgi:hypothetical protein